MKFLSLVRGHLTKGQWVIERPGRKDSEDGEAPVGGALEAKLVFTILPVAGPNL